MILGGTSAPPVRNIEDTDPLSGASLTKYRIFHPQGQRFTQKTTLFS